MISPEWGLKRNKYCQAVQCQVALGLSQILFDNPILGTRLGYLRSRNTALLRNAYLSPRIGDGSGASRMLIHFTRLKNGCWILVGRGFIRLKSHWYGKQFLIRSSSLIDSMHCITNFFFFSHVILLRLVSLLGNWRGAHMREILVRVDLVPQKGLSNPTAN